MKITEQQILYLTIGLVLLILYYMFFSNKERFKVLPVVEPGQPPIGWFIGDTDPILEREKLPDGAMAIYDKNSVFSRSSFTPKGVKIGLVSEPGKYPTGFFVKNLK